MTKQTAGEQVRVNWLDVEIVRTMGNRALQVVGQCTDPGDKQRKQNTGLRDHDLASRMMAALQDYDGPYVFPKSVAMEIVGDDLATLQAGRAIYDCGGFPELS